MYDYWLGGKDNFAADREAAEAGFAALPSVLSSVRANRVFLARSVRYLTREAGIRQFLDIGSGLPTASNTHEVAQAEDPSCRVVYADNDPVVMMHARTLLKSTPQGATDYLEADIRDPLKIIEGAARTLDLTRPVAVMMLAVLHFVMDDEDPGGIVARFMAAVPAGSYLVISHLGRDVDPEAMAGFARAMRERGVRGRVRSQAEVGRLFDGLKMLEPGVVLASQWRPESDLEVRAATSLWAGVASKPASDT
jgi:S-adenosyl methyltransferase